MRKIKGTIRYPNNYPVAAATFRFIASKFIQSGVPTGVATDIVTSSTGSYEEDILEGNYHVFFKLAGHDLFTHLIDLQLDTITGTDTGTTIEELIGNNNPTYYAPVSGCASIPTPSSFTATSGFTTIILSWGDIDYTCHALTEIYYSETNSFSSKTLLDTTQASVYSHSIGNDADYYYWIRFKNKNDDVGSFFSSTGVFGKTVEDPGTVVANLHQDIYDSSLFSSLRSNITSVFYETTAPTQKPNGDPLIKGDMWIHPTNKERKTWDTSQSPPAWVATVDKETLDVITQVADVSDIADGEIKGYFTGTEPTTGLTFGDIWINTSLASPLTSTAIKRYEDNTGGSSGTLSWRSAPTNALGLSYVKAYNADESAGVNSVNISTQQNTINGLSGEYTVKIDNNGHLSGFGLASDAPVCVKSTTNKLILDSNGDPITGNTVCVAAGGVLRSASSFIINADTFAVMSAGDPSSTPQIPFIVRTGGTAGTCYVNGTPNGSFTTETACNAEPGGSWVAPNDSIVGIQGALVLDGSMNAKAIVAGSIVADQIASDTITSNEIKGNTITGAEISSTTTIIAGTGDNTATMSGGASENYRFWAGHANSASAPFKVKKDGKVTISSAATGSRLVLDNDTLKVYNGSVLRVKLGNLA